MAEPAEKYEYIHPGPSKDYDYSWNVLQFPMIILWRSMLKNSDTSIQDHLKAMILDEKCCHFPMIILWRSMLKSMNASIQDHLTTIIIAEKCFNFQWLSYGGACWKIFVFCKYLNTSIQDHLRHMIIVETCFSFQWLWRRMLKVWIHPSRPM